MSEKLQAVAALGAAAPMRRDEPAAARVFEVPADKLLQDWKEAHARSLAYLAALGIPQRDHDALAGDAIAGALHAQPWATTSDAVTETLRALQQVLPERYPISRLPAPAMDAFLSWRFDAALSGRFSARPVTTTAALPQRSSGVPSSMPMLTRGSMVPTTV